MAEQSRTKNSFINIVTAISGQGISIIVSFIARIVFLKQLGEVYLGVNSLYTNIVGLLALAELGVGTAINYSLYKPIAENDISKIKSLMQLYKKVYRLIGIVILALGILLLPFLDFFMKSSEKNLIVDRHLIFFLFILNSSLSYFYSFKRALIISDQKRYIATLYRYIFFVLMNVLQIIILIRTKNFIYFLVIAILCTLIENILVSIKADSLYPYLKDTDILGLDDNDKQEIKKNTIALLFHKVGSSVVNSTDNIVIAQLIGIVSVAVYSNYLLITNALNIIVAQFFMALTASIGHLGVTADTDKSEDIFYKIFFINFWINAIITVSIYSTIDLLIAYWFGIHLIIDKAVLAAIAINFYIYQIRRTVMTYRDAYGLFWHDRYKALVEAVLNIIFSIILGLKLGLIGIFIGTIISTAMTSLWIEPFVLFKYGFKKSSIGYFKKLLLYSIITFVLALVCDVIIQSLSLNGIIGFLLAVVICVVIVFLTIVVLFSRSVEFQYLYNLIRSIIKNIKGMTYKS